ncbi:hypothetical protein Isop_3569 [Isosphaera pallida ATCC 43644]|uniref:Uncharacterized protein n=1 Tax=Isosphaera pallida (strain ATCC 43644 / DSM 9630 / IS1B) TaxID=575540 RepID=E8QXT9_ISOPI|nr:hypothetical protein [Isosphaera pallida]ADV64126.1 hypothetical protein Isop_3569 [Isosphaera pallida ATCC 43644]
MSNLVPMLPPPHPRPCAYYWRRVARPRRVVWALVRGLLLLAIGSTPLVGPATLAQVSDSEQTETETGTQTQPNNAVPTATVGMPIRLEGIVLPGSELEATPLSDDRGNRLMVRVARVDRHGTGFRYTFEVYGLEPGRYDVTECLRRKDRSPLTPGELPSLPIEVTSVLPAGQIVPRPVELAESPRPGGYSLAMLIGAAVWTLGLAGILLAGRTARVRRGTAVPVATLADHLRPLLEQAASGRLDPPRRAALERGLLTLWRRRLNLVETDPVEALARLKAHPEAGPLLNRLEDWLHRPPAEFEGGPADKAAVDPELRALLKPYRRWPATVWAELDRPAAASPTGLETAGTAGKGRSYE